MKLFDAMHKSNFKKLETYQMLADIFTTTSSSPIPSISPETIIYWKTQALAGKTVILQVPWGVHKKRESLCDQTLKKSYGLNFFFTRAFKCNNKIHRPKLWLGFVVNYFSKLSFNDFSFHFRVKVIILSTLPLLFFKLYFKVITLKLLGFLPGSET